MLNLVVRKETARLKKVKFHSLAHLPPRFNDCDAHKKVLRLVSVTHWQESCDSFVSNKYLSVYFILSNTRGR
jgi:protein involved in temperature-dependent protein secretion